MAPGGPAVRRAAAGPRLAGHLLPARCAGRWRAPAATDLERFAEAAELMEAETRRNGIAVAGRRFRIVRIERITLMGPDGPEPPRASDFDAR
ncbi:DUF5954 family protein [Actinomadura madurae]|nr:DUF5954 family protein [Actinomadura madurae]MCQ0020305.1 DUF5954 family protein [Actinomadura madurae]